MSAKAVAWTLLAAAAVAAVLLFNYWADYQPLSTLVYAGLVLALCGLANVVVPFRFLGIRKRTTGALLLAGGVLLTLAALHWPAPLIRVAHPATLLDQIVPEYQFSERHMIRIHAPRQQVMEAVRQSTFGDMTSLMMLLKVRGTAVREGSNNTSAFAPDRRILDAFAASGYIPGGSEHEIVSVGVVNVRAMRRPELHTLDDVAAYRDPGAVKMAFDFYVQDAGEGWSTLTAETRVATAEDVSRGMACYWRLIVPGSGLLRRQWLDGIKRRAESIPGPR